MDQGVLGKIKNKNYWMNILIVRTNMSLKSPENVTLKLEGEGQFKTKQLLGKYSEHQKLTFDTKFLY